MHYTHTISNLHCDRCIHALESIASREHADSVSVSLDHKRFSFDSDMEAHHRIMKRAEALGFISKESQPPSRTTGDYGWFSGLRERRHRKYLYNQAAKHRSECQACKGLSLEEIVDGGVEKSETQETTELLNKKSLFHIDGMTCASCVESVVGNALSTRDNANILSSSVTLIPPIAVVVHRPELSTADIIGLIEDVGFDAQLISSDFDRKDEGDSQIHSKLVIDGMTCSSCVASVKASVSSVDNVSSYELNLIPPVLQVNYMGQDTLEKITEAVEDAGFECHVVDTVQQQGQSEENSDTREAHVQVTGMFCDSCVASVNSLLEGYEKSGLILRWSPVNLKSQLAQVTYSADSPFRLTKFADDLAGIGPFTAKPAKPLAEVIAELSRKAEKKELWEIMVRIVISVVFAIPTFLIAVAWMSLAHQDSGIRKYFEEPVWGNASRGVVSLFALATPVQFYVGWYFLRGTLKTIHAAWKVPVRDADMSLFSYYREILGRRLFKWGSMDSLVAIGTGVAYIASVGFMAANVTSDDGDMGTVGNMTFFDTCVFLHLFILLGRFLELRTRSFVSASMSSATQEQEASGTTTVVIDGLQEKILSAFIEKGDTVIVPHGAIIPIDGLSLENGIYLNESSLTGESRPVEKMRDDPVYAGTINVSERPVSCKASTWPGGSVINQISEAMRSASMQKGPVERIADKATGMFVPLIVFLALVTWGAWLARCLPGHCPPHWAVDGANYQSDVPIGQWIKFTLSFGVAVLVVACPCGLGLAAPTASIIGLKLALDNGIIGRGGAVAFDKISHANAVAFDKTGTLTSGLPRVEEAYVISADQGVWALIYACELQSTHPLAVSVQEHCKERMSQERAGVTSAREIVGRGLVCEAQHLDQTFHIAIGNAKLMGEQGIDVSVDPSIQAAINAYEESCMSLIFVAVDGALKVIFGLADPPRREARQVVDTLQSQGIDVYMLTGDNEKTAKAIAKRVGIDSNHVYAELLPLEKQERVGAIQEGGTKKVLFVGDGVNDAAALAQADIAVSLDTGASIAQQAADFVILAKKREESPLVSLLNGLKVVRATRRRIFANIAWAIVFNAVLIPLAGGAFFDAGETRLPPVWSSLAMALSSVSVVCSSLLLRVTFRPVEL